MEASFVQHSVHVLRELNQQRQRGQYCDATLAAGGMVFQAHRSVLACCSAYFQTACCEGAAGHIALPETLAGTLALLLDFFYTGRLALAPENREALLEATKQLRAPEAIRLCQEFGGRSERGERDGRPPAEDPGVGPEAGKEVEEERAAPDAGGERGSEEEPGPSPCAPGSTVAQGQRGSPRLLRWSLRRAPQTNPLSSAGEVQDPPGCKRGDGEEAGASNEESQEAVGLSEATEEGDGAAQGKQGIDEDYVPRKSPRAKRRPPSASKATSPKAAVGNGGLLEAGALGNRRGAAEPVECPTCHKSFLSKYYLKVHNRKHTGEKPFECSKCGKCYFRKENLLEHEARNCMRRSEQVFTCSICQQAFKRRVELRLHMVNHTGEMPYKCPSCVQQFMQKKDLQSHLIKVHGAPKPHACPACSKCFLSRTELHLHEAFKHRGEKLFVCEECGHRASSRNGLQMHIKSKHRNERPYVCEFCHHAFTQKANLNMHLRTHTGEKPFQCHLCGKTFRTQASLDKHNRTHTGERPFSCEFCEQRFTERGPLLRHIASRHQEGRPHYCQICGKTFKAVEQLRVHLRRHKGMRKFECTECGYKFTRQAHLRRHMEIHDRVDNYNPRQRKLRNLIVIEKEEEEGPASPQPLEELVSVEVVVESGPLSRELPEPRDGANENMGSPDVIEQQLVVVQPPVITISDDEGET